MWAIFKDDNDYNEKSIIGVASFAVMTLFAIVDLGTGIACLLYTSDAADE